MSDESKVIKIDVDGSHNVVAGGNINIQIEKVSSLLSKISPQLLQIALKASSLDSAPRNEFKIDTKISYNQLKSYKPWVEKYSEYGHVIDGLYDSLDTDFASAKARIMLSIAQYYLSEKIKLLSEKKDQMQSDDITIIQNNSDLLFDRVVTRIKNEIIGGKVDASVTIEDVQTCSTVIASHGFIQCKILERPPEGTGSNFDN